VPVISGDKCNGSLGYDPAPKIMRHNAPGRSDMLGRPRDLAGRMAEPSRETITLPLCAARLKAREISICSLRADTHRSFECGLRLSLVPLLLGRSAGGRID
jgi:hypothetical protein